MVIVSGERTTQTGTRDEPTPTSPTGIRGGLTRSVTRTLRSDCGRGNWHRNPQRRKLTASHERRYNSPGSRDTGPSLTISTDRLRCPAGVSITHPTMSNHAEQSPYPRFILMRSTCEIKNIFNYNKVSNLDWIIRTVLFTYFIFCRRDLIFFFLLWFSRCIFHMFLWTRIFFAYYTIIDWFYIYLFFSINYCCNQWQ